MANITIRNGIDNELKSDVQATIADIKNNAGFQAVLKYAATDKARVNGYEVPDSYVPANGDVVSFEKAACTKA